MYLADEKMRLLVEKMFHEMEATFDRADDVAECISRLVNKLRTSVMSDDNPLMDDILKLAERAIDSATYVLKQEYDQIEYERESGNGY